MQMPHLQTVQKLLMRPVRKARRPIMIFLNCAFLLIYQTLSNNVW